MACIGGCLHASWQRPVGGGGSGGGPTHSLLLFPGESSWGTDARRNDPFGDSPRVVARQQRADWWGRPPARLESLIMRLMDDISPYSWRLTAPGEPRRPARRQWLRRRMVAF
jgi:hypothetical protein